MSWNRVHSSQDFSQYLLRKGVGEIYMQLAHSEKEEFSSFVALMVLSRQRVSHISRCSVKCSCPGATKSKVSTFFVIYLWSFDALAINALRSFDALAIWDINALRSFWCIGDLGRLLTTSKLDHLGIWHKLSASIWRYPRSTLTLGVRGKRWEDLLSVKGTLEWSFRGIWKRIVRRSCKGERKNSIMSFSRKE